MRNFFGTNYNTLHRKYIFFCTSSTSISHWPFDLNHLVRGFFIHVDEAWVKLKVCLQNLVRLLVSLENKVLRLSKVGSRNLYQSLYGWFLFRNIHLRYQNWLDTSELTWQIRVDFFVYTILIYPLVQSLDVFRVRIWFLFSAYSAK